MRLLYILISLIAVSADLAVIGAGLGRTGTTSLKAALEELGFGRTHHMNILMQETLKHWSHADGWVAAAAAPPMSKERLAILSDIFNNSDFHSVVDTPGSQFYKELVTLYPNAKVILTERDNAATWAKSVGASVGPFVHASTTFGIFPQVGLWLVGRLNPIFWQVMAVVRTFADLLPGLEPHQLEQFYTSWNADVRDFFKDKPEKLLIFNAKEGWAPLCKFLNVPVPNTPYPRANESANSGIKWIGFNIAGFLHLAVFVFLARFIYRRACRAPNKGKKSN